MYQIDEKVVSGILKKEFNTLVRTSCERLENLQKQNLLAFQLMNQIKFDLKKDSYNAMRNLEAQIKAFSKGVKITVELIKPTFK